MNQGESSSPTLFQILGRHRLHKLDLVLDEPPVAWLVALGGRTSLLPEFCTTEACDRFESTRGVREKKVWMKDSKIEWKMCGVSCFIKKV